MDPHRWICDIGYTRRSIALIIALAHLNSADPMRRLVVQGGSTWSLRVDRPARSREEGPFDAKSIGEVLAAKNPTVHSISSSETVAAAVAMMVQFRIGVLPVVDEASCPASSPSVTFSSGS